MPSGGGRCRFPAMSTLCGQCERGTMVCTSVFFLLTNCLFFKHIIWGFLGIFLFFFIVRESPYNMQVRNSTF